MDAVSSVSTSQAGGLKALITRHPLLSMYVLMFVLAWPEMIYEALYSRGLVTARPLLVLALLIGWAPGVAAVIVTAVISGRKAVGALLRRLLVWRVGIQYYLVAIFFLAVMILGGIGLHVLFGGAMPKIPAAQGSILNAALALVLFIGLGFLLNTEEIAWRGFALPRLEARYGVLIGCLLLAIPEFILHLPYFWDKSVDFYSTVGIPMFTAFSVAAVFIYAFIYNKTGSLLIVTIMHASQNAWANLLSDNSARPFYFTVALMWVVAIALILLTRGRLGYKGEPAPAVEG